MSALVWAFAVIGMAATAVFVVVLVSHLAYQWRTDAWVLYLPAFDPIHGEVDIEVRIPSLIPWRVAKRLVPRAYRRCCLDLHCYPIDPSTPDRKATP